MPRSAKTVTTTCTAGAGRTTPRPRKADILARAPRTEAEAVAQIDALLERNKSLMEMLAKV